MVAREVEPPVAEWTRDDPGRQRTVGHSGLLPPGAKLVDAQLGLDSLEGTDEVIDHPVGLGVVDVPAIELPVGDHVDAGQFLGLEHDHHRVAEALAGVVDAQPGGDRIAADDRGLDHGGPRRCLIRGPGQPGRPASELVAPALSIPHRPRGRGPLPSILWSWPLLRVFLERDLPFNLTGQLALTVPYGFARAGLPIGLQPSADGATAPSDKSHLCSLGLVVVHFESQIAVAPGLVTLDKFAIQAPDGLPHVGGADDPGVEQEPEDRHLGHRGQPDC
jgi:hypothetical protein